MNMSATFKNHSFMSAFTKDEIIRAIRAEKLSHLFEYSISLMFQKKLMQIGYKILSEALPVIREVGGSVDVEYEPASGWGDMSQEIIVKVSYRDSHCHFMLVEPDWHVQNKFNLSIVSVAYSAADTNSVADGLFLFKTFYSAVKKAGVPIDHPTYRYSHHNQAKEVYMRTYHINTDNIYADELPLYQGEIYSHRLRG